MLQLLNPSWLLGIGGILIPIIIHLWNVKTGKTLKVGSIMLMGESSRQNSRSLKLMDLLLLFLRCLLIILLSLILAEPVWQSSPKKGDSKNWILVEKDIFPETYRNFKSEIDSLVKAGNEMHLFEPGFEKVDLEELKSDTASIKKSETLPYWSLVKLMDYQIPAGSQAFIFTSDRLNRFRGDRPNITTAVEWRTFTPSDSSAKWIDHAYLSSAGDIEAIVTESGSLKTSTSRVNIVPGTTVGGIKSIISGGQAQLQLNEQTIVADTSTLIIAVQTEGFSNDREYLIAALDAIRKYTSRKFRIVKPSSRQDILFWLSLKSVPATIKANTVLQYAKGKMISVNTWMNHADGLSSMQTEKIRLFKRISYPENSPAISVWNDGFGTPLLDLTKKDNVSLYTFYSRLDPEWSDLVWSPEFVKLILPIIIPEIDPLQNKSLDKRTIEYSQIIPKSVPRTQIQKTSVITTNNLSFYFWLLLLSIFLTERYLSLRNDPI